MIGLLPSRRWNRVRTQRQLEQLTEVQAEDFGRHMLVVVPHPDDETLTVGGLVQRLLANGVRVDIYLATMGNKWGKQEIRRKEVFRAMAHCGLPAENIHVPEFDDGKLFRQRASLKAHLQGFIAGLQPDTIVVTATDDIHRDHAVLGRTVLEIVPDIASVHRVFEVLVHYKNFPRPITSAPEAPLLPPLGLRKSIHPWLRFMLTDSEVVVKRTAIAEFKSQLSTPLLRGLMLSFSRKNELFRLRYTRQ
jgi:N-acetylglucosamine malate deacetylase 1